MNGVKSFQTNILKPIMYKSYQSIKFILICNINQSYYAIKCLQAKWCRYVASIE